MRSRGSRSLESKAVPFRTQPVGRRCSSCGPQTTQPTEASRSCGVRDFVFLAIERPEATHKSGDIGKPPFADDPVHLLDLLGFLRGVSAKSGRRRVRCIGHAHMVPDQEQRTAERGAGPSCRNFLLVDLGSHPRATARFPTAPGLRSAAAPSRSGQYFAVTSEMQLLEDQARLQAEADEVLEDLNLVTTLATVGVPYSVESSRSAGNGPQGYRPDRCMRKARPPRAVSTRRERCRAPSACASCGCSRRHWRVERRSVLSRRRLLGDRVRGQGRAMEPRRVVRRSAGTASPISETSASCCRCWRTTIRVNASSPSNAPQR